MIIYGIDVIPRIYVIHNVIFSARLCRMRFESDLKICSRHDY